jgi:ABC-type uncharacterized transport system permease subunit
VPASALTSRLGWLQGLGAPALAALICVSVAWTAWDLAFRGYESTGS